MTHTGIWETGMIKREGRPVPDIFQWLKWAGKTERQSSSKS